jgi:hypothetical protein
MKAFASSIEVARGLSIYWLMNSSDRNRKILRASSFFKGLNSRRSVCKVGAFIIFISGKRSLLADDPIQANVSSVIFYDHVAFSLIEPYRFMLFCSCFKDCIIIIQFFCPKGGENGVASKHLTLASGVHGRSPLVELQLITQPFLSHNSARWAQAVTAAPISWTATHSSGPCALCSPQNRLGVGRPSSVRREPSVPPRTTWS